MLRILRYILLLFVLVEASTALSEIAPKEYFFTHLKSDAGLPHQQVSALAFDHDGMLWVGTRNGLAKYDGYSFTTYYYDLNDSTSIPHNFIRQIFVDTDNNVWIGSDIELCRYRRENDDFERYDLNNDRIAYIAQTADGSIICAGSYVYKLDKDKNEFRRTRRQAEDYVVGMAVSPDDNIFIATNKSIAYYSSDMTAETVMDKSVYEDFLAGFDAIAPLFFDRGGNLWIGRDGKGVQRLNLRSGEKTVYDETLLSNGAVRAIAEDASGLIWLGTENGITIINPASGAIAKITQQFGNSRALSDNAIYCIASDAEDNIWVGSYFGGVSLVMRDANKFEWIAPGYDSNTLSGKAVRRIIEPHEGELWLATEDGGINIYHDADKTIEHFDKIPGLGTNVHELYYDADSGDMWIGTFRNGLFRYNLKNHNYKHYTALNSGLKSNAIFAIARQPLPEGELWIGTTMGLLIYNPQNDDFELVNHPVLKYDFTYCLLFDHAGNLWVGTVNNGLFRIDKETKEIRSWNCYSFSRDNKLNDNYITALYEDCNGRVFVGTNNDGVYTIDGETFQFSTFRCEYRTMGTICNIFQDSTKNIWITTSGGLYKVNPNDLSYVHFTTSDGLPDNQFNFASTFQTSDRRIYCGTVNGMISFLPEVKKRSEASAGVHLWKLLLNNAPVAPDMPGSPLSNALDATDEVELDYNSSRIFSIVYGIVDPVGAKNAKYQIYIEGLDKEWRDVGSQRSFTAMELPYGTYVFKVRALLSGVDWNMAPVKSLKIKVAPPYYLSSTAWLIYILLGLFVIYMAYRLVNWRMKEKQQKKLSQIERAKNDELNQVKMEFFTNISHELKTPLSLILAPLKHLSSEQNLSNESKERLSTAIANTSKMVDLINELVTFNRVESGNFQLFLQKDNPLKLIETLSGYFRGPASEKNITVNITTQDNGEEVWFSTTYLERIVSNLLSNAVKYTAEGGNIDVRASIEEGDDNNIFLHLEVKDNGIGIVPEEIDNIFRKYYQTKRGYNASHSGWGIGLATVKRLIEIHKGSIAVSSKVGEGSTFIVKINVTQSAFDPSCCITNGKTQSPFHPSFIANPLTAYNLHKDAKNTDKDENKVSILIVEDNPELLRFLSDEFEKEYNVYTATNGKEALAIAAEYTIDIVVSDVMMPEMDGVELCEKLKNDLSTSHIPVILLTAKTDEESTIKGFESGAEAYVPKPFDPQILALRVKNILRARRKYINSRIKETPGNEEVEELPALNKFDNEFISRINALVESNIENSELSVTDITRELGISRSLLHIKMKTFFKTSMTDYIKTCRMHKACELLRQGFNVSETAYRTGFSDPNYFSKVFKNTYGMTPREYLAKQPES